MRIQIAAVGRLKDVEERDIVARYVKRFGQTGRPLGLGPVDITELPEARDATAAARMADEAQRLLKSASKSELKVALDPGGKGLSSEAFARWIAESRDRGAKSAAFLIGGPDGHDASLLKSVELKLSLGPMTLPHGLARVVLLEQLYRAATILAGHPYHRA